MTLITGDKNGPQVDDLTGTDENDTIYGYELDDILIGGFNDDLIYGGNGSDAIYGGFLTFWAGASIVEGNDTIYGGQGNDIIEKSNGHALIYGGTGNDLIHAEKGNYTLYGDDGNDSISSSSLPSWERAHNTTRDSTPYQRTLYGGLGDDEIFFLAGYDSNTAFSIYGGDGNDTLYGYTLEYNKKTSYIYGGNGNDDIRAEQHNAIIDGGTGNDTIYSGGSKAYGGEGHDLLVNLSSEGNTILYGGSGNDTLDGGYNFEGETALRGGDGDDTYIIDMILPSVIPIENADQGIDTVRSQETYTLSANFENLILTETKYTISGYGNNLNNKITGNNGANWLDGGAGNDTLDGGAGIDTLIGGTGRDVYITNGLDKIIEASNAGIDTVHAYANYKLGAYLENLTLLGSGNISATGNDHNNILTGNKGNNTLYGSGGMDTLIGGAGNDVYTVSDDDQLVELVNNGIDTVYAYKNHGLGANFENLALMGTANLNGGGNSLNNSLSGNSGANVLKGGLGHDIIRGNMGNDILMGGDGMDKLSGGMGRDLIYGGSGDGDADMFIFSSVKESSTTTRDVIYNFVSGQDDISLGAIDANTRLAGNQAFTFNGTTAKAGAVWYKDIGANIIVYADVNRDALADFAVEIAGINSLKATDFIL